MAWTEKKRGQQVRKTKTNHGRHFIQMNEEIPAKLDKVKERPCEEGQQSATGSRDIDTCIDSCFLSSWTGAENNQIEMVGS
jgi:hypothetical protein